MNESPERLQEWKSLIAIDDAAEALRLQTCILAMEFEARLLDARGRWSVAPPPEPSASDSAEDAFDEPFPLVTPLQLAPDDGTLPAVPFKADTLNAPNTPTLEPPIHIMVRREDWSSLASVLSEILEEQAEFDGNIDRRRRWARRMGLATAAAIAIALIVSLVRAWR